MTKLRILSKNYTDVSTLTADPIFPASTDINNLKSYSRRNILDIPATSGQQDIKMQLGAPAPVTAIILGRHTFPEGMTLRIYLYSDTTWTTIVYDSTVLTIGANDAGSDKIPWGPNYFLWGGVEWGADNLAEEFAPKANYVHWVTSEPGTLEETTTLLTLEETSTGYPLTETGVDNVQSIKIVIDVPTTVDIEIGRLIIGEYLEPTYTISYGHTLEWTENTKQYRNSGGTLRSSNNIPTRQLSFSLNTINESDRSEIQSTFKYAGMRKDLFISLFHEDNDIDKLKDYSGIMKLTKIPSMSEYIPLYYKSKYIMEEV